jgi:hypothetical protein
VLIAPLPIGRSTYTYNVALEINHARGGRATSPDWRPTVPQTITMVYAEEVVCELVIVDIPRLITFRVEQTMMLVVK